MNLIQCLLGPRETQVGGQTYNFQFDREQRAVAEVYNLVHLQCFLSVEHYIAVQPLPILQVQIPAVPAPSAPASSDNYTLLGSSILPSHIDIPHGEAVQLGDVVAIAYSRSGLDIEGWNSLPAADRETALQSVVDTLRANAEREKAVAEAQTAEEAEAARLIQEAADQQTAAAQAEVDRLAAEQAAKDEAAAIEAAKLAKLPVVDPIIEIAGIGPRMLERLTELEITSFAQIAAWDAPTVAMMDDALGTHGAIARGDWVGQAKALQAAKEAAAAQAAAAAPQA